MTAAFRAPDCPPCYTLLTYKKLSAFCFILAWTLRLNY
jgi:hypothetical protein